MDPQSIAAVPLGAVAGFLLGGIGGGGSMVAVPILVCALGLSVSEAATTSLVVVGLVAGASGAAHARGGRARVREGLLFAAVGLPAAGVGSWAGMEISARVLMPLFGALMLVVSTFMWRSSQQVAAPSVLPSVRWRRVVATASGVGFLTGFFGIGGGFIIVPALVLSLGIPMTEAVGTSLIVIAVMSVAALVPRLASGRLVLAIAVPFASGGILGAALGMRLASRLSDMTIRRVFAVAIALLGVWLVIRNLG